MRFHIVALPHTRVSGEFSSCAFTQKVLRFCKMMRRLGHETFLYSSAGSEVETTETIVCGSEEERLALVAGDHYTAADWDDPRWQVFNTRVVGEMKQRIEPRDFICLIGGTSQRAIAEAFPAHLAVEFGIGYSGTFAKWRVFESYAWMHTVYGAEAGKSDRDGRWFDAVVPNQVEPQLFPEGRGQGDEFGQYALFVGRLTERKGWRVAQEVCQMAGVRLLLAGPGEADGVWGEFVGEVGTADRASLMGAACCLFAPTQYIEPFGTVAIEAMACGTPVISSDWGAFTETVEQGRDGWRCRSFGEFTKALEGVGRLDRRGIRERALARFSVDVVGAKYQEYFERLAKLWDKGWYA